MRSLTTANSVPDAFHYGLRILPVPQSLWSVMILTFHCARFLRRTLKGVFSQDPGADVMQIELVDDCPNDKAASEIIWRLGTGRVTFYAESQS